jgi:hypothetical protein
MMMLSSSLFGWFLFIGHVLPSETSELLVYYFFPSLSIINQSTQKPTTFIKGHSHSFQCNQIIQVIKQSHWFIIYQKNLSPISHDNARGISSLSIVSRRKWQIIATWKLDRHAAATAALDGLPARSITQVPLVWIVNNNRDPNNFKYAPPHFIYHPLFWTAINKLKSRLTCRIWPSDSSKLWIKQTED